MAVSLHAFFTFVLTNFCFTAFFEAAHGLISSSGLVAVENLFEILHPLRVGKDNSRNDFIQGIFYDALSSEVFEFGNEMAHGRFADDCFDGDPVVFS